jgi:AraC-like DNA-binding protein
MMRRSNAPRTGTVNSKEVSHRALAERIARWTGKENLVTTAIPSLRFHRWEHPTDPTSYTLEAAICLIAQGRKRVLLGEESYVYDAHHFLITSVDLPIVAQIIEASTERPYLGLALQLDPREIAQLMVDGNIPPPPTKQASRGMAVGELSVPLLGAFLRLIDLLDNPRDIPILAPLVEREILYRLLVGEQQVRLQQIAAAGTHGHQIARAIEWLKDNFARPFRVDDLASYTGMSASSLHQHFRALTAMSPLQFQKRLRLNEARRLMLTEHLDAGTAAFQVGYESPSQFSREYSRLFGAPPLRDIKALGQVPASEGA